MLFNRVPNDVGLPILLLLLACGLIGAWVGSRRPIGGLFGFVLGTFVGFALVFIIAVTLTVRDSR